MFDIVLVLFFLLMVYLGWKNGFVKAFMRFFGFFFSAAIAYMSYAPVSSWLMTTPVADNVGNFVKKFIVKGGQPDVLINIPLPDILKNSIQSAVKSGVNNAVNSIEASLTTIFISLISMALIFVLAFLALKILEMILNNIVKLPVLSFFNKICGFLMGIINGVICVYILVLLSSALTPFIPWLGKISEQSIITNIIF